MTPDLSRHDVSVICNALRHEAARLERVAQQAPDRSALCIMTARERRYLAGQLEGAA